MRILEAGHYYLAKGPTAWSVVSWETMLSIKNEDDENMLFIDDIHCLSDVSLEERVLPKVEFNPKPDYLVLESEVVGKAWEFLEILKMLPRRRRARMDSEKWYCSGFPLTTSNRTPNCVLLDAGLTLIKSELGFHNAVNILPKFYEEQQNKLLRLVAKALPDFNLQVITFDLMGRVSMCSEEVA